MSELQIKTLLVYLRLLTKKNNLKYKSVQKILQILEKEKATISYGRGRLRKIIDNTYINVNLN